MNYWIFKVAVQDLYHDVPGEKYIYDNRHSMHVKKGDIFLYLDKQKSYSFTATGSVRKLTKQAPTLHETARSTRIKTVITAHLEEVIWFSEPLSISNITKQGKQNRARLGIVDVNLLGWSQSIPRMSESMFQAIIDLAETRNLIPPLNNGQPEFYVPDNWSKTKSRQVLNRFSEPVRLRSNSTCIVCGTALPGMVEAAHLSPYSSDPKNRANPANGVCLCKYCHRALDLRLIAIQANGEILVAPSVADRIAKFHFSGVSRLERKKWLKGVDPRFLELTVKWFKETTVGNPG